MAEDDETVLSELRTLQYRLDKLRERLGIGEGSNAERELAQGETIMAGSEDLHEEFRDTVRRAQALRWKLDQRRLSRFMREAQSEDGLSDDMKAWWWHRY